MLFKELNIISPILQALESENYKIPTPIQIEAIPPALNGRDLLGCAQTGTGKTAAFAVPTLQLLSEDWSPAGKRYIRSLVLTPTRELAVQIAESFNTYGKHTGLRCGAIFGGVPQKPQEIMLQRGIDILVATPGRLNDLINQNLITLNHVRILILDEADNMLDMGFIHEVKKIIAKTPVKRQTLLFSATMPQEISKLAYDILDNPVKISITPECPTVEIIDQSLYFVDKDNKRDLLLYILKNIKIDSALVFTRTKHGADRVVKQLIKEKINAQAIHGDKSQNARQAALNSFKNKETSILVATDIAARGIDIDELSYVINFDLPNIPETYVHRIGRTGRAGLGGSVISFCDIEEKEYLKDIEKLMGKKITVINDNPYPMLVMTPPPKSPPPFRTKKENSLNLKPQHKQMTNKNDSGKLSFRKH